MADTPVEARIGITGQTLTLKLYPLGSDSIANGASGDSMTEETNRTGVYRATVTEALTGYHEAYCLLADGTVLYVGIVSMADNTGVKTIGEWAVGGYSLSVSSSSSSSTCISGTQVTMHKGDSISVAITGLGDISGRAKLWFTAKKRATDVDASAKIFMEETDGLTVLEGDDPGAGETGSITVNDDNNGDVTIELTADASAQLNASSSSVWDIQMKDGSGTVTTLARGSFDVTEDVTKVT